MRTPLVLSLLVPMGLAAQAPTVKWHGALWASGAVSDRAAEDGTMFLRSADAGHGQLAVDGLQLGADIALPDGFALKFTALAGQTAKVLNASTLNPQDTPAETGSIAWPEAMLTWTGKADVLKFGRMYTPMGMEVLDGTQDITASRGILYTYAIPFAQVGLDWHHTFSGSWSTDVYVFNGEDRVQDNNTGKTAGLGITYNHGGAADKFVTLMAFSGPEQGSTSLPGAEGRKRDRLCLSGGWTWGKATLLFEGEQAREAFPRVPLSGPIGRQTVKWSGYGAIYKYQFNDQWNLFARAETLSDGHQVRLASQRDLFALSIASADDTLKARSFAVGAERRWHTTFTRLEARRDSLDHDAHILRHGQATGETFRASSSLTWSLGTTF